MTVMRAAAGIMAEGAFPNADIPKLDKFFMKGLLRPPYKFFLSSYACHTYLQEGSELQHQQWT